MCAEWFIKELRDGNRASALEWLKGASAFVEPRTDDFIAPEMRALADAGFMPASEYVRRVEEACASAGINITPDYQPIAEQDEQTVGFR
jgi:hypothetical protein